MTFELFGLWHVTIHVNSILTAFLEFSNIVAAL